MLPMCESAPVEKSVFSLSGTMGTSLLDPSCSGSGIVNRLDHLTEYGMPSDPLCLHDHPSPLTRGRRSSNDCSLTNLILFHFTNRVQNGKTDKEDEGDFSKQERLEKLASFQLMMIKHAMRCKWYGPPSFSSLSISKNPIPNHPDVCST